MNLGVELATILALVMMVCPEGVTGLLQVNQRAGD
jgi:hypothetical protein